MQRDVKIGLSLGLLLVVIVAALFFRREPERTAAPPALADAESLNRAIGERERSPYTASETDEFPKPAPPPSARRETATTPERLRVPGVLASDDAEFHERVLNGAHSTIPEPIPSGQLPAPAVENQDAADAPAGNGLRTHTIKAGDKLTLLAARYLGSSGRFHEIYNANKNVLRNPNQLPVGVTIVIPPKDQTRTDVSAPEPRTLSTGDSGTTVGPAAAGSKPAELSKPADTAQPAESAAAKASAKKKLFSPSKRGPFSAGRAGLPKTNSASTTSVDEKPSEKTGAEPSNDGGPSLPQIEVNDRTDLLDPDNESIERKAP